MARPAQSLLKDTHPELIAQLVDKSLSDTLSTGSSARVEWCCNKGHRWFAKVFNRTNAKNGTGCPVCSGKVVQKGFNDIATTDPDVAKLCVNPKDAETVTRASSRKLHWRCENGHEWVAPVSRLTMQGSRCPYCSGRLPIVGETDLATTNPDIANELVNKELAHTLRAGSAKKVDWVCSEGHVYKASPYDRTGKNTGCPYCSGRFRVVGENDLATVYPEYAATLAEPELAKTLSRYSDTKVEWVCQKDSTHRWFASPNVRLAAELDKGCPVCDNKQVVAGVNDLATTHPELAVELVEKDLASQLSAGSGRKVEWRCDKGHIWVAAVYHRTGKDVTGCPVCNPTGTSKMEQELAECVRLLLPSEEVLTNVRGLLSGRRELDILVPSRHVAIEFNGVRWHSDELGKQRNYHLDKLNECNAIGYRLIHVWEDEWLSRKNVVIRLIAAKLGITNRVSDVFPEIDKRCSEHLFARKLKTVEISGKAAGNFLEANHIQGRVVATRHFGLVDSDNVLRAVLSIRSPRNNARMNRKDDVWEIQRYATFGSIAGGFTKLLKYAQRILLQEKVELSTWISFSANDVSDGHMYEACGFKKDAVLPPDYRYVGEKIGWWRHPKEQFQRKRFRDDPALLWDESWTESRAAKENDIFRVWDSGKIRWILDVVDDGTTVVDTGIVDVAVVTSDETVSVVVTKQKSEKTDVKNKVRLEPDLVGQRFGYWTVLGKGEDYVSPSGRRFPRWTCQCVCGTVRDVATNSLRSGKSASCGCAYSREAGAVLDDGDADTARFSRHPQNPMSVELCKQLINKDDASLKASSHKKVWWRCDKGHEWEASIASRTKGSGCPYCSGRKPVRGETDLATLRPDIAAQLVNPDDAYEVGIGSAKKLKWRCDKNPDHVWEAQVRYRCGTEYKRPTGCPYCSGSEKMNK